MLKRVLPEGWLVQSCPSGGDSELDEAMMRIFVEAFELWARKQRDYGPENIAKAGEVGVSIRLNDKIERLRTLLRSGKVPDNESIRDTWIDVCVYGAIGVALNDDTWPHAIAVVRCPTCGSPHAVGCSRDSVVEEPKVEGEK